jgi:uncharacterized membrane protein YczE
MDGSLLEYAIRVIVSTFQQITLRLLPKLLYLLLLLGVSFFIPFLHLLIMELESFLVRMVGLRVGFPILLPLLVNCRLQIIPKEFSEGLPGV